MLTSVPCNFQAPFIPTPEEFKSGAVFSLKTLQKFSVYITPEEFENAPISGKLRAGKSSGSRDAIVFEKLRFQVFSVTMTTKHLKAK